MRIWMACGAVLVAALALACGDDGGTRGSSGGRGGGGQSQGTPSQKPLCDDPGSVTGGVPAARADSDGALSADSRKMLMFGGDIETVICGQTPSREHVADSWVLDTACGGWRELTAGGPPARARHNVVSDFARNRAILFGGRTRPPGQTGAYTLYNDVWAFDFVSESWAELSTTGSGPSARSNAAAAVVGDELWVFGGSTSTSGLSFAPQNDLYALNLVSGEWKQVTAGGAAPPARLFHAMTADAASGRLYVAHGGDENAFLGPFFTDLWGYDIATSSWQQLQAQPPAGAPEGRIKLGLAARSSADGSEPAALFLVGGHDDGVLGNRNDTQWLQFGADLPLDQLGPMNWQHTISGDSFNAPANGQCNFPADFTNVDDAAFERRSAFTFAPTATGEAFVVFGGDSDCGRLSDAWWYDSRAGIWEEVRASLPGLTCPRTGNPNCSSLCG